MVTWPLFHRHHLPPHNITRTNTESTERVPSVPFYNVCAAQSPVGDRMSRLEERVDSLCNQFQKHNTDGKDNHSCAMQSCYSCQGRGHYNGIVIGQEVQVIHLYSACYVRSLGTLV